MNLSWMTVLVNASDKSLSDTIVKVEEEKFTWIDKKKIDESLYGEARKRRKKRDDEIWRNGKKGVDQWTEINPTHFEK